MVILVAAFAIWRPDFAFSPTPSQNGLPTYTAEPAQPGSVPSVDLGPFSPNTDMIALVRFANPHTIIPTDRPTDEIKQHQVVAGDALFAIAVEYKIKPESLLWANYAALNDNADMLSIGQTLYIPPEDGVLYQWKEGDILEAVASRFNVSVQAITGYPGNHLDMTNPVVQPGQWIMAPGGHREFKSWVVPMVFRPKSGVLKNILGPGGCDVSGGLVGGGAFVWPSVNHVLSGNDFWSGHMGIDIAAGMGAAIYAADTGVVVYAGPIGGGYGNMIMIDHGNGYQTLYGHLSGINVRCGGNAVRGQLIGLAGSTGNSTGPHLHFEVRYLGGFINPWKVLP
jgi:hypothetical protein